ncbi:6689_t:CDS:2, partial [Gigaspora margarita]
FEKSADFFEETVLQKEDRNLDFDKLPQFASNQHIIIEFEKAGNYFEQMMLQKKDRNLDFDELPILEFEETPNDLEPILLQREESEDPFIDFNELEHNHRDYEFVHFIEDYLKRIREQEEELIRAQVARDNVSVNNFNAQQTQNTIDKENIKLSIKFKNPRKVAVRGRPKFASYYNQASENIHSKKKCEYNCRICKRPGHNAAICLKGTDVTDTDDTETEITE